MAKKSHEKDEVKKILLAGNPPLDVLLNLPYEIACDTEIRNEVKSISSNFTSYIRHFSSEGKAKIRNATIKYLLGYVQEAIEILRTLPSSKERNFFLGISYLDVNKGNKAYECLSEVDWDEPIFQTYLAESLIKVNKYDEALKILAKLEKTRKNNPDVFYLYGLYNDAIGNYNEAESFYKQAIATDSHHQKSLYRLAYNEYLRGDEDEAYKMFEKLSEMVPPYVNTLMSLGVILEDKKEYERARNCFRTILDYYPNNSYAKLYLKDLEATINMFYDEETLRRKEKLNSLLKTPIGELGFTNRLEQVLSTAGIMTLGDLAKKTEASLLALEGVGKSALREINEALHTRGLTLAENEGVLKIPSTTVMDSTILLRKSINDFEWPTRIKKVLDKMKIYTIGDLVSKTERDFLENENFGMTSLKEIERRLAQLNLSLRQEQV